MAKVISLNYAFEVYKKLILIKSVYAPVKYADIKSLERI